MIYAILNLLTYLVLFFGYVLCWFYYLRVAQAKVPQNALPLFGVIIPPLGIFLGFYYILLGPTKRRMMLRRKDYLEEASDEAIAKYIDESSYSSLIATNSAWYKEKWHVLSNEEKVTWVNSKRSRIIHQLPHCENAIEVVTSLSKIDW